MRQEFGRHGDCVTGDELKSLLAGATAGAQSLGGLGAPASQPASFATDASTTSTTTPAKSAAPQLQVNGNNPATVSVGETYADLGATRSRASAEAVATLPAVAILIGSTRVSFVRTPSLTLANNHRALPSLRLLMLRASLSHLSSVFTPSSLSADLLCVDTYTVRENSQRRVACGLYLIRKSDDRSNGKLPR